MNYVFKDREITMAFEAKDALDDYEQIEITNMTKNIMYNSDLDRLLFNKETEEMLILEKIGNSKLLKASSWKNAIYIWVKALKDLHNIDEKNILKRVLK